MHLQAEVDHLRQHLAERDAHIVALEGEFIKCTARANDLEEQLGTWREKYERYCVFLKLELFCLISSASVLI